MTDGSVKYKDGYAWQLHEDAVFDTGIKGYTIMHDYFILTVHGRLMVKRGYATDGITGVTGWPWGGLLGRGWLKYASFGHDPLCQAIRLGLLPAQLAPRVHAAFKTWCLEAGAWEWQAAITHKFVLMGNGLSTEGRERPVLVAP